mmetsp:Transcript_15260/g.32954  ORF Transcript_15260/g.32954 Transcript_15260/m.32954 type:complete len:273 (+) Transcript_15260:780-1598(+)
MDVRTTLQHHLDRLASPGLLCFITWCLVGGVGQVEQRGFAILISHFQIGPSVAQGLHKYRVGVFAGFVERASAVLALPIDARATAYHSDRLLLLHFPVLRRRDAVDIHPWPSWDLCLRLLHCWRPLHLVEHPASCISLFLRFELRWWGWHLRDRFQQIFQGLLLALLRVCCTLCLRCPFVVAVLVLAILFLTGLLRDRIPIIIGIFLLALLLRIIFFLLLFLGFRSFDEVKGCLFWRAPVIPPFLQVFLSLHRGHDCHSELDWVSRTRVEWL